MIGLLAVGWIIVLNQPVAIAERMRTLFVNLTAPLARLGERIPSVRSRRELARENQRLRRDNERLGLELLARAEMAVENQQLRHLLGLRDRAGYRTVAARVIGRDASNWWKSIQLDRGRRDGIREDMPVVDAHGLVGRTVRVTETESRVLLLVDPACQVGALLQEARAPGIVSGWDGAAGRGPRYRMTFVSRDVEARPGQLVVTSGLGGVFPRGIPIGTVVRAELDEQTAMYQNIELQPVCDFNRLEYVLVIVGHEPGGDGQ
jgi:rod shape-determining protein MreC